MSSPLAVAFVPWLVFVVAARNGGLGFAWASGLGLACATGVVAHSVHARGNAHTFEWATAASLLVLALTAVTAASRWPDLDDYGRAFGAGCVALVAFSSLARRPLSEPYTRESVRPDTVCAPEFAAVNRRITMVWGTGALVMAVSFAVGALLDGALGSTVFNWFVPMAIALGCVRCGSAHWRRSLIEDDTDQALLAAVVALPGPGGDMGPPRGRSRHLRALPDDGRR